MKLSDFIASFLYKEGVRHVFGVTGGASVHLIDSIAEHEQLRFICAMHEQAAAMAADGYARASRGLGCALATSGPGATNLITGICSAYYDSIPVLFLTGQVATFRMKGTTGVRQIGFQETDILSMCLPVTKYSVQIQDPQMIHYELEKACFIARDGRPGPVIIDIPDNLQREEIEPEKLKRYIHKRNDDSIGCNNPEVYAELLLRAKRPVVIFGWGIHAADAEADALNMIEKSGVPFAPTWAAADLFASDHPLYIGTFGTHGTRYGNFAVQNADLILSVGSRLDSKATGSPPSTFARGAVKIVVDIDRTELDKFAENGPIVEHPVHCDAKIFLRQLNDSLDEGNKRADRSTWLNQIANWKKRYPICLPRYFSEPGVNPYVLFNHIAERLLQDQLIVADTGCTLAWLMQSFSFKKGQRLFHDWNTTAMGWALPASIGVSLAKEGQNVICISGDGGLQMNLQELASVIGNKLPIKMILVNNKGYGMIQQTQDQWLGGRYHASSVAGGLAFPDFGELAKIYGFPVVSIKKNEDIAPGIEKMLDIPGFCFCNVDISLKQRIVPLVKFGRPNEDMEPLLEREEFLENMIVAPLHKERS